MNIKKIKTTTIKDVDRVDKICNLMFANVNMKSYVVSTHLVYILYC